jgi:hypothetical protein
VCSSNRSPRRQRDAEVGQAVGSCCVLCRDHAAGADGGFGERVDGGVRDGLGLLQEVQVAP